MRIGVFVTAEIERRYKTEQTTEVCLPVRNGARKRIKYKV